MSIETLEQPMRCGGVYERVDISGNIQQGVLISVTRDPKGITTGTFLFHGFAPKQLRQDTVEFQKMLLVGRPASPKMGRPRKE